MTHQIFHGFGQKPRYFCDPSDIQFLEKVERKACTGKIVERLCPPFGTLSRKSKSILSYTTNPNEQLQLLDGCSTAARWLLDGAQWLLDGCSTVAARRLPDHCSASARWD